MTHRRKAVPSTSMEALLQQGFTLIELIVAIALIAIMMGLAAPSFVKFQRNSELTTTANTFLGAISVARAEAMKRNQDAFVWPGTPVSPGNDWAAGWFVFVDINGNHAYDDGVDLLVDESPALPLKITLATTVNQFGDGTTKYIRFNGSGFPRTKPPANAIVTNAALDFTYDTSDVSATRRVLMSPAGRTRVCKPDSASCAPGTL